MNRNLSHDQAVLALIGSVLRRKRRAPLATLVAIAATFAPLPASAQEADGQRLFQQRCGSCHTTESGKNKVGPHLSGVIGRRAGTIKEARYSDAMRASGIVWDSTSLDAFLAAPRKVVPGTQMTAGIPNTAQRAAIITYLTGAK